MTQNAGKLVSFKAFQEPLIYDKLECMYCENNIWHLTTLQRAYLATSYICIFSYLTFDDIAIVRLSYLLCVDEAENVQPRSQDFTNLDLKIFFSQYFF